MQTKQLNKWKAWDPEKAIAHIKWAKNKATEAIPGIESELIKTNAKFKFHIYAGTEHAFFNDERLEIYNKEAAELSFERNIDFLNTHIR